MPEVTKDIVESFAVLSTNNKSWTKELNLVSWNGREARFDLREWSPDKTRSGKGITLKVGEMENLVKALEAIDLTCYATE